MATLSYEVDFGAWRVPLGEAYVRTSNLRPALDEVGELVDGMVERNIKDGGGSLKWPDLSEATLIARARHPSGPDRGGPRRVFTDRASVGPASSREARVLGAAGRRALASGARKAIEGATPLIWTGALLRSIRHVLGVDYVDIGSTMIKSWTLFFGSKEGKHPVVPARSPFGLTRADEASIMGAFVRHIFGNMTRGQS